MKRYVSFLMVVILALGFAGAHAEEAVIEHLIEETQEGDSIGPMGAENLMSATATLSSDGYASFFAVATSQDYTVYVSRVTLQKKSGNSFKDVKTVSAPSGSGSGGYAGNETYSFPSSGTYRLKVVWVSGGKSYTRYSSTATV